MYLKVSFFLSFIVFCMASSVFAQTDSTNEFHIKNKILINKIDTSKERDIADVIHSFSKKKQNDSTRRDTDVKKYHLSFVPAVGYTLQTGFAGIVSENLAYRVDRNPATKLSSITTSFTYSQYHQSIVPLQADIWTKGNKYNIVSDNRFIQYPSDIYGLGGKTDPSVDITVDFSGLKLHETILKTIAKDFYLGAGIYFDKFWNIKGEAVDSLSNRRVNRILGKTEVASGLAFKALYDNRLNQLNPTIGTYANIVFRPSFTFMGSQTNWQSLLLDLREYFTFPKSSHNVIAIWNIEWLTTGGKPPYLILPSTGWDDQYNTGRGYIQGRFRGNNMYYVESEYRFRISRNGLIGGVVFANAEKFTGNFSSPFNSIRHSVPIETSIAPGAGVGLRLKLNKFSGANLCVDYGFGENGSRGFFVNLGEVF